uniref:Large ribosomal subunit protein uL24c n=1 Tax=Mastocarpus papillatus TaxID=31436 RepID=A0A342RZG8_9FLOR|nr:50S ribosomal protein L24 [Mastocarpus papillatus]AOL58114.1 50S ribosomal protein L24 [Mastocarpus papillatus]
MTKTRSKIHVKQGDTVKIITGSYRGHIGEVIKVIPKTGKIIVEKANIKTKHVRPKKEGETGQIIQIEAPIHSSNVMLYSKNYKTASRYNYITNDKNIKQRILKKTREIINNNNHE